ncbi:CBS domain-containing protein [Embleya sp. AB8]|uniref:CBS domain-containing protein n=1 Tax=Embleya sp. AB8 TaxID=3156304 RepID=UPI003C73A0BB
MYARDLVTAYPVVTLDDDALDVARLLVRQCLPGVLVVDDVGEPYAVLPASSLIGRLVPGCVLDDPTLAAILDEPCAGLLGSALAGHTVRECMPPAKRVPSVADADATALEVAALLARDRSPLVAVVEYSGDRATTGAWRPHLLGVITPSRLLEQLLGAA